MAKQLKIKAGDEVTVVANCEWCGCEATVEKISRDGVATLRVDLGNHGGCHTVRLSLTGIVK